MRYYNSRHLLLHFTTGITIHDKCNYNSRQVLQFTTLLHFTTAHTCNKKVSFTDLNFSQKPKIFNHFVLREAYFLMNNKLISYVSLYSDGSLCTSLSSFRSRALRYHGKEAINTQAYRVLFYALSFYLCFYNLLNLFSFIFLLLTLIWPAGLLRIKFSLCYSLFFFFTWLVGLILQKQAMIFARLRSRVVNT